MLDSAMIVGSHPAGTSIEFPADKSTAVTISRPLLVMLAIFAMILGKVVRWRVANAELVQNSIGWSWLRQILQGEVDWSVWNFDAGDSAVGNSLVLYHTLGSLGITSYVGFEIAVSIVCNIIALYLLRWLGPSIGLVGASVYLLLVGILNVFDFTLSKDPIQFLFIAIIAAILLKSSRWGFQVSLGVILVIALVFRAYYCLLIPWWILWHFVLSRYLGKNPRSPRVRFRTILGVVSMVLVANLALLVALSTTVPDVLNQIVYLRSSSRVERYGSGIAPWISTGDSPGGDGSLIWQAVNAALVSVRLAFPVELLVADLDSSRALAILFLASQLLVTAIWASRLSRWRSLTTTARAAVSFWLAFLCMSALFEPDFGSWTRHEAVCLPVIILFLASPRVSVSVEQPGVGASGYMGSLVRFNETRTRRGE